MADPIRFEPIEIGGIVREVKASNGLTYRPVPVTECKTVGQPSEGIVEAIVSVTGLVDDVQDIIEVGAYKESLAKRTPRGCWAHKWDIPVAKTLSVTELAVGHSRLPAEVKSLGGGGLFVTMQFNLDTQSGKEAYSNVKFFDDQQSWSIGYQVPAGGAVFESKTGIRRIKRLDLYEYSPVLFGAMNLASTLSVKSRFTNVDFEVKEAATESDPEVEHEPDPDLEVETTDPEVEVEAKHGTRGRPGYPRLHPGGKKPTWTKNPDGSRTTHTSNGTPVTIHPYRGRAQHQKLAQEIKGRGGWRKVLADEMNQIATAIVYSITRGLAGAGLSGTRMDSSAVVGKSAEGSNELESHLIAAAVDEMERQRDSGDDPDLDLVVTVVYAELGASTDVGEAKAHSVNADVYFDDDAFDPDEMDLDLDAVDEEAVAEVRRILDLDDSDELHWPEAKAATHSSASHPGLDRSPKKNWVERAGGLPSYIERIAKHLVADRGMTVSHAIAAAINQVKKWAAGGGGVKPATRAKAAAAVAQWEKLKAKNAAKRDGKGLINDELLDGLAAQQAWLDNTEAKIAPPTDAQPTTAQVPDPAPAAPVAEAEEPGDEHVLVEIKTTTPGWRVSVKDHEGNVHHLAHQPSAGTGPVGEEEPIGPMDEKCGGCAETKRHFSSAERRKLAASGAALPDGSFPILTEEDLKNAIYLLPHAKDPAKARAHIASRASAIGAKLPKDWGNKSAESTKGDSSHSEYTKAAGGEDGESDATTDARQAAGGDSANAPPTGLDGDDADAGRTSPDEAPAVDADPADANEHKAAGPRMVNLALRVASPGVKVRVIDASGATHELPLGATNGNDITDDAIARESKDADAELEAKVAVTLARDDPEEPWEIKVTTALLAQALEAKEGRVLSSANASRIRAALRELLAILSAAGVDPHGEPGSAAFPAKGQVSDDFAVKSVTEVAALSEAELMEFAMLSAPTIHRG